MKNKMQDVRDHLVAMMERLGDSDVSDMDIAKAKALSELATTFTGTVKVEIDARRMAGREELPSVLAIGRE